MTTYTITQPSKIFFNILPEEMMMTSVIKPARTTLMATRKHWLVLKIKHSFKKLNPDLA